MDVQWAQELVRNHRLQRLGFMNLPPRLRSYFTKTHSGLSSGNATSPMIAVAATSRGLLTFQRNKTTRLPSATSAVRQSPIEIFPCRTQAPTIVPKAAA